MAITNADGSIVLTTKVDQSGLKKGMFTMKSGTSSLMKVFGKLGAVVGAVFSVAAIVKFSKETSNLATKSEASVQRLIDIYGEASKTVGDFIDANARALGMSKSAAASYASVYGNLFSVWADQATNAQLTNAYLNMTAVVASKTGRTVEDVQERIRSGLLGNTEAIEDLGVFVNVKTIEMTDAFQRMANGKSWEQLDAYTQQQIRTFAILEQATQKYGSEVAQTSALTKAQFQAAWQDFQATWGQVVNRVLMPVLQVLTKIILAATTAMQSLFGISNSTVQTSNSIASAVENQNELTNAIQETEKAAKKAVAPFDDLQTLSGGGSASEEQATGGDVSSSGVAVPPIVQEIEKAANLSLIDAIEEKLNSLGITLEPLKKAFKELWNALIPDNVSLNDSMKKLKEEVLEPVLKYVVEEYAPLLVSAYTEAVGSINALWATMKEPIVQVWKNNIKPIFKDISLIVIDLIQEIKDAFSYLSESIRANKDEIQTTIKAIGTVLSLVWAVIKPVLDAAVSSIGNILKRAADFFSATILTISNYFSFWANLFKGIVALIQGDTETAIGYFKLAFANFVNIWVGVGNAIISIINTLWIAIFSAFKGAVNAVGGLLGKLGEYVGKDWGFTWTAEAPIIPSIPKYIPKLAQGTVVPPNREFLAVLGDNTKEHEIVSPISTMKQAFAEAMLELGGNFGSGNTEVVLEIDGREFGRAVVEQGNRENRRIGTRLVIV